MNIHQLTPAQLALIPQVRDEWMNIGLATGPVDSSKISEILARLYAVAGKPAPKNILHLDSPLQISNAITWLRLQGEPAGHQVIDLINGQVREQLFQTAAEQINEQTVALTGGRMKFESTVAWFAPGVQVIPHIREEVRETIRRQFPGFRAWPFEAEFGQFNATLAWFDFVGRLGIDVSKLTPSFDLAKACGMAVLFWDWAFICARPQTIQLDGRNQLHCETGAAIRYPDGFSVFAIHGVRVPGKVVASPGSLTVSEIESEKNAEVRRVMIARFGPDRFLMESHAEEIHRDDFGILYGKEIPGDESLVMVKVANATPEPDGSFRDYFLRVPPTMRRAKQAVAWTFGKEENNYAPAFQT